jgi:hypothetical protein
MTRRALCIVPAPRWDERRAGVQRDFKAAYARACPDFQTVFPLEYGSAPSGNVITAKTQVSPSL